MSYKSSFCWEVWSVKAGHAHSHTLLIQTQWEVCCRTCWLLWWNCRPQPRVNQPLYSPHDDFEHHQSRTLSSLKGRSVEVKRLREKLFLFACYYHVITTPFTSIGYLRKTALLISVIMYWLLLCVAPADHSPPTATKPFALPNCGCKSSISAEW